MEMSELPEDVLNKIITGIKQINNDFDYLAEKCGLTKKETLSAYICLSLNNLMKYRED